MATPRLNTKLAELSQRCAELESMLEHPPTTPPESSDSAPGSSWRAAAASSSSTNGSQSGHEARGSGFYSSSGEDVSVEELKRETLALAVRIDEELKGMQRKKEERDVDEELRREVAALRRELEARDEAHAIMAEQIDEDARVKASLRAQVRMLEDELTRTQRGLDQARVQQRAAEAKLARMEALAAASPVRPAAASRSTSPSDDEGASILQRNRELEEHLEVMQEELRAAQTVPPPAEPVAPPADPMIVAQLFHQLEQMQAYVERKDAELEAVRQQSEAKSERIAELQCELLSVHQQQARPRSPKRRSPKQHRTRKEQHRNLKQQHRTPKEQDPTPKHQPPHTPLPPSPALSSPTTTPPSSISSTPDTTPSPPPARRIPVRQRRHHISSFLLNTALRSSCVDVWM